MAAQTARNRGDFYVPAGWPAVSRPHCCEGSMDSPCPKNVTPLRSVGGTHTLRPVTPPAHVLYKHHDTFISFVSWRPVDVRCARLHRAQYLAVATTPQTMRDRARSHRSIPGARVTRGTFRAGYLSNFINAKTRNSLRRRTAAHPLSHRVR